MSNVTFWDFVNFDLHLVYFWRIFNQIFFIFCVISADVTVSSSCVLLIKHIDDVLVADVVSPPSGQRFS